MKALTRWTMVVLAVALVAAVVASEARAGGRHRGLRGHRGFTHFGRTGHIGVRHRVIRPIRVGTCLPRPIVTYRTIRTYPSSYSVGYRRGYVEGYRDAVRTVTTTAPVYHAPAPPTSGGGVRVISTGRTTYYRSVPGNVVYIRW